MRLTPTKLYTAVLCILASVAGVYSFVYSGDPHYEASCKIADYLFYSVAAIGGVGGIVKYVILRHPVPTLRSVYEPPRHISKSGNMPMLPTPPENLVKKLIPLLSKVVGITFFVSGAIFLVLGCVIEFMHGGDSRLVGAVFIGGSILQIFVGIVVVRYVPSLMLGVFRRLRER